MARTAAAAEQLRLAENALAAGRFVEAADVLQNAVRLDRDSPRPRLMLAYALAHAGRSDEAVRVLQQLIERSPSNADAWFNLGNLLRKQHRFDDSVRAFRRAALLRPDNLEASINLGYALGHQGRFVEAEEALREALARFPGEPDLLVNLAQVQRATRRWADALATLERCLALAPGHIGYRVTRCIALHESGQPDRALADLSALLEAAPGVAEAHFARAQMRLSRKDWLGGWEDYLWRPDRVRWLAREKSPATHCPVAPGELSGKRIVLIGEQGLGDTLFFLRFARLLAPIAGSVAAEVDPRLAAILPRDWITSPEAAAPLRILCGDLPAIFRQGPLSSLQLAADADRAAVFKARLANCGPPPYVGLSWQGGVPWQDMSSPGAGLFKRVAPAELGRSLRAVPGTLVSLQRAAPTPDVEPLAEAAGRQVHDFSFVNESLPDALALLAGLDEYVAVSNTNVHLNEAIGRRTRVLVTQPAEWRWTSNDERSPWFQHAVLYRQSTDGSWTTALGALQADLLHT